MRKRNRFVAVWLCLFVVLSMLFATSFIAHEASHECIGTDCEICAQTEKCQETLEKLIVTTAAIVIAAAATYTLQKVLEFVLAIIKRNTPFTLKVKLLN